MYRCLKKRLLEILNLNKEIVRMTMQLKQLIVLLILTLFFAGSFFWNMQKERKIELALEQAHQARVIAKYNTYKDIDLIAKSAFVKNLDTDEVLYAFRPSQKLPLASITKIMTALVASKELESEQSVIISRTALLEDGDSGLLANEIWNSFDLITFMLIVSSNDATKAIAEKVESQRLEANVESRLSFVDSMNDLAQMIGMNKTFFENTNGLDFESIGKASAVGTAEDVATMFKFAYEYNPELFFKTTKEQTQFTSESGFVHSAKNTNKIVENLEGIVLSKTGFTDLSGGNLGVVVVFKETPYALIVLGSTQEGRFSDIETLYKKTKELVESGILNQALGN